MKPAVDRERGFTLLELAVVIAIIAIITGMSIQSGVSVIATARQTSTQQKMQSISDALQQYATANRRLPCPADLTYTPSNTNYGVAAANPGACTGGTPAANFSAYGATNTLYKAAEGALPATTLGLPQDFMYDGWGNRFRYAVDVNMTALNAFTYVPIGCVAGAITVNDVNGNARTTGAIYALISHGANGHGAYTKNGTVLYAGSTNANEWVNCHCNATTTTTYAPSYVQMNPSVDSTNAYDNYDDVVSFKERWQLQTPWDMAGACTTVYVSDNGNSRIAEYDIYGNYLKQLGSSGIGLGNLSGPKGIAIDSSGNIWVADSGNNRIEVFYTGGTYLVFPLVTFSGTGNGQFNSPSQIAFDSSGNLWVVDTGNSRLQKFDKYGNYITQFGSSGTGSGQFTTPTGVAIDSSGNLWVVDQGNYRVQEFSPVGTYLGQFGTQGTTAGLFAKPATISIDASGNFWVTDITNTRVQEYSNTGTYLNEFGSSGSANGTFASATSPENVAFDINGYLWITDTGNNRVEQFNSSGTWMETIGTSGTGQLSSPWGVAVTSR